METYKKETEASLKGFTLTKSGTIIKIIRVMNHRPLNKNRSMNNSNK